MNCTVWMMFTGISCSRLWHRSAASGRASDIWWGSQSPMRIWVLELGRQECRNHTMGLYWVWWKTEGDQTQRGTGKGLLTIRNLTDWAQIFLVIAFHLWLLLLLLLLLLFLTLLVLLLLFLLNPSMLIDQVLVNGVPSLSDDHLLSGNHQVSWRMRERVRQRIRDRPDVVCNHHYWQSVSDWLRRTSGATQLRRSLLTGWNFLHGNEMRLCSWCWNFYQRNGSTRLDNRVPECLVLEQHTPPLSSYCLCLLLYLYESKNSSIITCEQLLISPLTSGTLLSLCWSGTTSPISQAWKQWQDDMNFKF